MLKHLWIPLCLLSACATTGNRAAQKVADLDRAAGSTLDVGESTKAELKEARDAAVDFWLREELSKIPNTSDPSISQTQKIIAEADRRGRKAVAADAEVVEGQLLERREPELAPLIASGQWLQALSQMESWVAASRSSSPGQQLRQRVRAQVKQQMAQAENSAPTLAEKFVFGRMKAWVGDSTDLSFFQAATANNVSLNWGSSACGEAQVISVPSSANGTPVTVQVTLGSCDVRVARASNVPRSASYQTKVQSSCEEQYTVMVERSETVTTYDQRCEQVTKNIATTGPKNYITVTECNRVPSTRVVTSQEPEQRTRMVPCIQTVTRTESFFAETADFSVDLQMSVSISGDGQAVTSSDRTSSQDHDEQYSRSYGSSRSFRSGIEDAMKRGLRSPVESLVRRALTEWSNKRGLARLNQARASQSRELAIQAVALNSGLAEEAAAVVKLNVTGAQLLALVSGSPAVPVLALASGAGIALPDPSASVADEYARLEERQATARGSGGLDSLAGIGAALQPAIAGGPTGALALEVQVGWVPEFAALSHLVARVEGDLQMFLASAVKGDLSLRPELGFRLGPIDLSAVAIAGGRIGLDQLSLDPEADPSFVASAYVGYGPHLAIHLGPVLLDAMALRLHQANTKSVIAMRGDATLGIALSEAVYLISRLRYVAQGDIRQMFKSTDRFASLILGIMLQF